MIVSSLLTKEDLLSEEVGYWFEILEQNNPIKQRTPSCYAKPIEPEKFRRLVPMIDNILPDDWGVFADAKPSDIDWPIDVGFIAPQQNSDFKWLAYRVRSIDMRALRGRIKRASRYMLQIYTWAAPLSDPAVSLEIYSSWLGNKWTSANDHFAWSTKGNGEVFGQTRNISHDDFFQRISSMSCGLAFNQRYEWGVEFKSQLIGASILLPTDPRGILELFRTREKDPGVASRRSALAHWVRQHMRKKRSDHEAMTFVRKHLRGRWTFDWRGFTAEIHPAPADVEKLTAPATPP